MVKTTRVSAKSDPRMVAGYIANHIDIKDPVEIIVIGAAALNQAIKGITIAGLYLGESVYCEPMFTKICLDEREVTAIKLIVSLATKVA
jgi:stage V sporulation protein S